MKKNLPLLIILTLISLNSFSQVPLSGYLNFSPALPMGEYKDVSGQTIWGGRLGVLVKPYKKLPLRLGIELGYATQGFRTQYFNSIGFSQFSDYRARARLNMFSGLFNIRLQDGGKQRLKPFVEALIGWNNFYGTTKLEGRNPSEHYSWESIDKESTKGYWSLAYGGSIGFNICLEKRERNAWLECKIAYLKGNNTKYYTNPTVDAGGFGHYTLTESKTDMLIPQIGIKFGL